MHDLPLTVLAPTDRRDSQLIRLRLRAADRNGGVPRAAAATGQLGVSEQECSDLLAATMEGALWYRLVE